MLMYMILKSEKLVSPPIKYEINVTAEAIAANADMNDAQNGLEQIILLFVKPNGYCNILF